MYYTPKWTQIHRVVVTARDAGAEPRLATATATVIVIDVADENPKMVQTKYQANVPENAIDVFVVQVQVTSHNWHRSWLSVPLIIRLYSQKPYWLMRAFN